MQMTDQKCNIKLIWSSWYTVYTIYIYIIFTWLYTYIHISINFFSKQRHFFSWRNIWKVEVHWLVGELAWRWADFMQGALLVGQLAAERWNLPGNPYHTEGNHKEMIDDTLQGTNISPQNGILKMIFLFPRWDMLVPWRVYYMCMIDILSMYGPYGERMRLRQGLVASG